VEGISGGRPGPPVRGDGLAAAAARPPQRSRIPARRHADPRPAGGRALDAQPARKTFWTFSVWEDEQSLSRFAAADPHRLLTKGLQPQMGPSHFEFFPISGGDVPLDWDEVRRRLATAENQ
jgi:hypothetical protein